MKSLVLWLTLAAVLTACDKKSSPDSTKERAGAEQEAARDVENQNQAAKAEKMEKDLKQRHFFYSAVQGQYQGTVKVGNESFGIKITLAKSLAPYTGGRVRQLSEIESDLNNLFFHAQVVQWHPADPASAVGCRVSQLRPDMSTGTLTIASNDCPNLYKIYLSDGSARAYENRESIAQALAVRIKASELDQVSDVVGMIQPSMNANTYTFAAKRTN